MKYDYFVLILDDSYNLDPSRHQICKGDLGKVSIRSDGIHWVEVEKNGTSYVNDLGYYSFKKLDSKLFFLVL